MLTIFSRISSEKSGLSSDSCFISEISERVRALTSSEESLVSSRYSTAALKGYSSERNFLILNRFRVDMNIL